MMALELRWSLPFRRAPVVVERPAIVDINVLPRDQRPADLSPVAVASALGVALAILALVPLSRAEHGARVDADAAQAEAAAIEREVQGIQVQVAQQRGLQSEIAAARTELAKVETERAGLQGGSRPLAEDLVRLWGWDVLPAGMLISTVTGTDGGLRIEGTTRGPLDALAYADALATTGGFASARLTLFAPGPKDTGQFTIEVSR